MKQIFQTKSGPLAAVLLMTCILCGTTKLAVAQEAKDTQKPKMKMTTDIPESIVTPDKVETPIGTLEYFDGVPIGGTKDALYDYVDRARAVQVYIEMIPAVSTYSLLQGSRDMNMGDSNQIVLWEQLGDSKSLVLTYNNTSLYTWGFLDLEKDGPTVIEVPPDVLGILDDGDMRYLSDMGAAGPDKGKGGKYLVLPPGYEGDVPEGYFVVKSTSYVVWNFMRGYVRGSVTNPADVKKSADNIKANLKVYPLAKKDNPPKMEFKNMSGVHYNTVPPNDFSYFERLNEIIQKEPIEFIGPETRGLLAGIGIEKGKPFKPDARMKKLLTEAVAIGSGYARANTVYPRDPGHRYYPETDSEWVMAFPDKNCFFLKDGIRRIDARLWMHFNAVCVTPAMAGIKPGVGSDYGIVGMDSKHQPLDGAKTYKLHLPPNVPAKDNWSVTIYDTQHRSMLQTDQPFAGVNSLSGELKPNADGSYDIYFAPKAPKGKESNWIQTVPEKSWFILLRLYGPLKPWLNKTWRPSELELVK
ncbi:DUF1254 domain-containing protein [Novipirellula artificiosorum]|uniref:DUF1254 domain-containing protein n=1 Tax=Novipirellula artificiosorum TaxID=2528016 RepID=A0A5C6D9W6_9BACT|nr:DUF1254 domain-containing protein [Novipirellula artificiosorum]TWU31609.1 hypothetical protein Poly41_61660 [Novipirellula artificiosorum]